MIRRLHLRWGAIGMLFSLLFLLGGGPARASDPRDFYIYNKGTEPIYYIHVSHISEDKWGPDIMASDEVLEPDERIKVTFNTESDLCYYDVQAVYKDGDTREKRNVDLCETSSIDFYH